VTGSHYKGFSPLPPKQNMQSWNTRAMPSKKFTPEGRPLPFSGCTIISHLEQQGAGYCTFDNILNIYRDLPTHSFRGKLAILPPSSYHVTILDLLNEGSRMRADWPGFLPRDAPMDACSIGLQGRLSSFKLACELPITMAIDDGDWNMRSLAIPLKPFDEVELQKILQFRQRLAAALCMTLPQPDDYRFHITIAYRLKQFDEVEQRNYEAALSDWKAALRGFVRHIDLTAAEFCIFSDMFSFRKKLILKT